MEKKLHICAKDKIWLVVCWILIFTFVYLCFFSESRWKICFYCRVVWYKCCTFSTLWALVLPQRWICWDGTDLVIRIWLHNWEHKQVTFDNLGMISQSVKKKILNYDNARTRIMITQNQSERERKWEVIGQKIICWSHHALIILEMDAKVVAVSSPDHVMWKLNRADCFWMLYYCSHSLSKKLPILLLFHLKSKREWQ